MAENDSGWQPPSEAEMKVMQAKRDRSEKISKLMAEYLLKGFKMLSSVCPICESVLLQDRQKNNYCVACSEVDSEHSKDNPALSGIAAQRQIEELQYSSGGEETTTTTMTTTTLSAQTETPNLRDQSGDGTMLCNDVSQSVPARSPEQDEEGIVGCIRTVQEKMTWASRKLAKSNTAEASLQWCSVLKACAETMLALRTVQSNNVPRKQ